MTDEPRRSPISLVLIAVGVAMSVRGVLGVLGDPDNSHPVALAGWVVGADLAHDLLLVPLASTAAWALARVAPRWARPPLLWTMAVSTLLLVVGWPFIAGYGRNPLVPSLLNRNYARGVGIYVAVVTAGGCTWAGVRRHRLRRTGDEPTSRSIS